tara:strand:- start:2860 stop:3189 length:330 start_codon:yes stop_codon:yes gene_type:complete
MKTYLKRNKVFYFKYFSLKLLELKREEFKDVVLFYNEKKDNIDKINFFLNIKNNFIKQYKKISISDLKYNINYFIEKLNISDRNTIMEAIIDTEINAFNQSETYTVSLK